MLSQKWDNGACVACPECVGRRRWYDLLKQHSWSEAMESAVSAGDGGFEDWRLPTLEELRTIVEPTCRGPAINLELFPGTDPLPFWTGSIFGSNANYAWRVDFWDGAENADLKSTRSYRARLVRGREPNAHIVKRAPATKTPPQRSPFAEDGIHDLSNPGLEWLQNPLDMLDGLPRDRRGATDWVAALEAGAIAPRADRDGVTVMETVELDVIMKDTREMPWVKFPHERHSQWLACPNCHPVPFVARAGANPITMGAILSGEWCGLCHGKVAFSPMVCERCHSVALPAEPVSAPGQPDGAPDGAGD